MSCLDTETIPCAKSGDYWGGMTLTFETSPDGTSYTPIDISGYTVSIDWKPKKGGDTALLLSTSNNKISLSDPTNGIASVLPITSISLTEGEYIGEIFYLDGSNNRTTYGYITWEIE